MNRRVLLTVFLTLLVLPATALLLTRASGRPALQISFSHYERESDSSLSGVVRVRNTGSATACYHGHGPSSPFYEIMIDSGNGWTRDPMFWCGTGAGPVLLRPGDTTLVRVYRRTNEQWKVGINFHEPTFAERFPAFARLAARWMPASWQTPAPVYTAWSPPVRRRNAP